MSAPLSQGPARPRAQPDWSRVEHVLLDMDGTVLDLAFDTHFWDEVLPQRYAGLHGLTQEQARARLAPWFRETQGQLQWYCLDHWTELTGLPIAALKAEIRHRIAPLPGAVDFLDAVRRSGRALWLVTNAHHDSWRLKLEQTKLHGHFDRIVCSHDFGAPKEDARFWQRFVAQHPFDPARALFADDSLPVLRAARAFGLGEVLAIRAPDSSRPLRIVEEFAAVDRLADLLPLP